ncbi:MAG: hypothetical protein C5B52_14875 [Bacteroidetes bacterium]|nr:MAG: hypothetical protein C5B52_14875 [Bacteroidota bacterium]
MIRADWKLLLAFLLFPFTLFAQKPKRTALDSLSDYSYFLFGVKGGYFNKKSGTEAEFYFGTGFFVKQDQKVFLVSAKHVLTPCNIVDSSRDDDFPDSLYVRIKSRKTKRYMLYPIRIKMDSVQCRPYYQEADAYAYEIKNPSKYFINSVEKFVVDDVADSSIESEAYTCGYPNVVSLNFEELMKNKPKISKIKLASKLNMVLVLGDGIYDTINYFANLDSGVLRSGNSGSPVFFQDKKDGKFIFGGLLSRGSTHTHETYFVKPKEVIEKIREVNQE